MSKTYSNADFDWDDSGVLTVKNPEIARALVAGRLNLGGKVKVVGIAGITDPMDLVCDDPPPPPPPPLPNLPIDIEIKIVDKQLADKMGAFRRPKNQQIKVRVVDPIDPVDTLCP